VKPNAAAGSCDTGQWQRRKEDSIDARERALTGRELTMAITYVPIANSTYLDYSGYRITDAKTVESAYGITDGVASPYSINVALVLPRVTEASELLKQDWGTRQQTLQDLNSKGTLWDVYGASESQYDALVDQLTGPTFNLQLLTNTDAGGNYVSSAEARTIWVHIDTPTDFQTLFNTELMYSPSQELIYWNGNLSLPTGWDVAGLWVHYETRPPVENLSTGAPVTLPTGAQSIGNSTVGDTRSKPQDIAGLYNFPFDGEAVQTLTVGLIEPQIGSALSDEQVEEGQTFQGQLDAYLTTIGRVGTGTVYTQGNPVWNEDQAGERSLDVGVVAAINPNSDIALYSGPDSENWSNYTAIQSAVWDQLPTAVGNTLTRAVATSNSWADDQSMSPGSPFHTAYWELFVDAALANQTTVIALGDGGSSNQVANGLTNVRYNFTQPWNLLVGGTSLSTTDAASKDSTLDSIVLPARGGNMQAIWQLVAGGLTSMPLDAAATQALVETVWNTYYVTTDSAGNPVIQGNPASDFSAAYNSNSTGSGGVDVTQSTPSYQLDYGLHPVTQDSKHEGGRGVPDVSAAAGGNLTYMVPNPDMVGTGNWEGTSAASPLWASLIVQIDTIFQDQGLPNLGYSNDLLYTAAKIAPAAFNDVTIGNNISSYFTPGAYSSGGETVSPTGYGYAADWGYDLTTGLGSPNGLLLARALTAIAQSEMSFDDSVPDVFTRSAAGGWISGADQSLLIQAVSDRPIAIGITAGSSFTGFITNGTAAYAWDARLAGQSEQRGFDANLVTFFDSQGQGGVGQVTIIQGDAFAVSFNGTDGHSVSAALTNQFGFVDFQSADGLVRVARPVAVAETVSALDDQTVVVNIRQNGTDDLQLTLYKVDDFTGSIGGISPGAAGYEAAAHGRAYGTAAGVTTINGPGYGNFKQIELQGVDAGDIVAMKLVDATQGRTYWAFSQANEQVNGQNVSHIWNYGLNTWGFEDTYGGGDHDYNDLVVNLDFTSAYGQGWLI
jgi:hypothetical protein